MTEIELFYRALGIKTRMSKNEARKNNEEEDEILMRPNRIDAEYMCVDRKR